MHFGTVQYAAVQCVIVQYHYSSTRNRRNRGETQDDRIAGREAQSMFIMKEL